VIGVSKVTQHCLFIGEFVALGVSGWTVDDKVFTVTAHQKNWVARIRFLFLSSKVSLVSIV